MAALGYFLGSVVFQDRRKNSFPVSVHMGRRQKYFMVFAPPAWARYSQISLYILTRIHELVTDNQGC